jgi:hypothetical protein
MHRQIRNSSPQFLIALVMLFALGSVARAADATLAWDANTESDLAGYKIYYGNGSHVYGSPVILGKVTTYTITNLPAGTYYFAVTAYNTAGLESGYSNEVSTTISGTTSKCDMNADGAVNVQDMQVLINAILALQGATANDLNGDSRVDILDLQILCNVILGLRSCPL